MTTRRLIKATCRAFAGLRSRPVLTSTRNYHSFNLGRPSLVYGNRHLFSRALLRDAEAKQSENTKVEPETETKEGAEKAEEGKPSEVETLKLEVQAAEKNAADLKDRLARSLAEMENLRERTRRDVAQANKFAVQGFAKDLLEVSDNLARATEAVPKELLEKGDEHIKALHEGVVITEKSLHTVFAKHKITRIEAFDKPFDPNFHEGLFEYPDANKEAGIVGQVVQEGWMLHERVLRPSKVGTTKSA
eukprot:CAMPEP_0167751918 /NCGR_PEP_ID=MMETSP0110_2-20121227/6842_1 /TAXON_ID=629695 /ORGANISM="Gymnochlora sp., Strain CCMP2014" /LENGTH=246 /DNA_ID=CAMNT_0007637461 /DNA_START=31 /DNA_END=771 /DNA_ORIENTATION=+